MDSRKLFGSVMAISLLLAALIGAVYAWQAIHSQVDETSNVGVNETEVTYVPTGAALGPDGYTVKVADGTIKNVGSFPLQLDGGIVDITDVNPLDPGDGECKEANFTGSVVPEDTDPVPPGGTGGAFHIDILTEGPGDDDPAPAGCQGDQVVYTVHILLSNPPAP